MKEYNLKPCPFCGGIARVMHYKNAFGNEYSYVECTACECETTNVIVAAYHCSDDLAVEAWNKRVIDSSSVLDDEVVIHCDHCEHHDDECQWCKKLTRETQDDCFCSWAERRQT